MRCGDLSHMRVGITGASGFVGRALVEEGVRRGWAVSAFSRDASRDIAGATEVRSLADLAVLDVSGLDGLVNLAGSSISTLWTAERKKRIRDSRVDLTAALVAAMGALPRGQRPAVFVSASATGYYGDRADEFLDEESELGFGFLAEVCRDWEAASAPAAGLGVRVVNPRIGLVLGPGGLLKRLRPIFKLALGGRLGRGRQWMPWIHLDDLVRLLADCVEQADYRGAVNAVSPHPAPNREFASVYARTLGRRAWLPAPGIFLKRLPGGMGTLFLDSQRVEPVMARAVGFQWHYPDLATALREVEHRISGKSPGDGPDLKPQP